MNKARYCIVILFFFILGANAQLNTLDYELESLLGYTSPDRVPFWLRSNQFGSIPLDKGSLSLIGAIQRDYNRKDSSFFDWGISLEGRANLGHELNFMLIEGYGKFRLRPFEFKAGRSKEIMGLCDSTLSVGSYAVSGNALGIPKVEIVVPEFYSLPVFGELFAFKGSIAHGWIGEVPIREEANTYRVNTYLHQLSFYGRFGKPDWKLKLFGGFNHQALWGSEAETYGEEYAYTPLQTYFHVIRGDSYMNNGTRIGNHLGSIDLGIEYVIKNTKLFTYRQSIYEAGALYYLANIVDGLNGLSLTNLKSPQRGLQWQKILVEVFYTKNQGEESAWTQRPSGEENYYNHYQYMEGWSYLGNGLGNPFITPRAYAREGLAHDPLEYFVNNRVMVVHFGIEASAPTWDFVLKASYSMNNGTYRTIDLFPEIQQLSTYFKVTKELRNGLNLGVLSAFDAGDLLYDSFGLFLSASKSF